MALDLAGEFGAAPRWSGERSAGRQRESQLAAWSRIPEPGVDARSGRAHEARPLQQAAERELHRGLREPHAEA